MRRLLLLTLLLPVMAFSQTVKLVFPDESPRRVWTTDSAQDRILDIGTTSAKAITLDSLGSVVCVQDEATGNLAVRSSKGLSTWTVKASDFTLIGKIQVRGEPAPTTASYSCQGQTVLVTPDGDPTATFFGVKPGKVDVSVTYSVAGTTKKQTFVVELKRADPVPVLLISLNDSATAAKVEATPPAKATSDGGMLGKLAAVAIVGAIAAAILIFGLKWIYKNQDKAQDALCKLGVQVPDPIAAAPNPGVAPASPIPAPMKPIVLDDATVGSVAPPALGHLRLAGALGNFDLTEGVHVVGREAGLTISLVGESTVSRRHAEIVVSGGSVVVRDLGSTNGTFVDGQAVDGDVELRRGSTVRFGSVQFKVE